MVRWFLGMVTPFGSCGSWETSICDCALFAMPSWSSIEKAINFSTNSFAFHQVEPGPEDRLMTFVGSGHNWPHIAKILVGDYSNSDFSQSLNMKDDELPRNN
jgi:hypothetical protein